MFWNKKDCCADNVTCNDCRCILAKKDAKQVQYAGHYYGDKIYFCRRCKPAYDVISYSTFNGETSYYVNVPATQKRVNKDGSDYVGIKPLTTGEKAATLKEIDKPTSAV